MKRVLWIGILSLVVMSCRQFTTDPDYGEYEDGVTQLSVQAVYPDEYGDCLRSGVTVRVKETSNGNSYTAQTDDKGVAHFTLSRGLYRISITDAYDDSSVFNGTVDRVKVLDEADVPVSLKYSRTGALIIKEIYCGGCPKTPEQGTLSTDQYILVHNNSARVQYLDGLCLGVLDPFNSNGSSVWTGDNLLTNQLPIIWAVWQIKGDGSTYPLQPGEDAVISVRDAVDHAAQYPLSVNLNKPGYFACYNSTYFAGSTTNPTPAPGDNIDEAHYLRVVIKTGQSNAYTMSVSSPAVVIFKPTEGVSIDDFVQSTENVIQKPGSSSDRITLIPFDWVLDAVEVFNGSSSSNNKRMDASLDAGYVTLSAISLAHSLMRLRNDEMSESVGYDYYVDTNNSTSDFEERSTQSLRE